jgi:sulfur carrier protein ThiS
VRVHATLHGFAPKERDLDLEEGATADDAPRACGIRPELVLVFRDERPIPGDAPLKEGDRIRILRVVSGGAQIGMKLIR